MARPNLIRYLRLILVSGASVILHVLATLSIYFAVDHAPPKTKPPEQLVEIVFQDLPSKVATAKKNPLPAGLASRTQSASRSAAPTEALTADIFSGGFRRQTLQKLAQSSGDNVGSSTVERSATGHGWSDAVQFGNSMDLQQTFVTLPFFMALHAKVDSALVYPDDFSRQRLMGKVRIEAELGPDGRLLRFVGSVAQDKVLQTYCLAYLMQTLRNPLPQRAWANGPQIVAFEFDFHTHIPGEPRRVFPSVVRKNRLAFGRDNQIEPWVNERLTEIFTHYIPPIIPLPGGVYIDFVLAYQYIENLIEGAPTERDLRQGRIDSLHLHLKDFLRHSASPTPQPSRTTSPES
ncbi:MAG: hypothetical protein J0L82_09040 [Deltaproteobacteria bacterium]|nr:hypothetical protein [Deltaproteobacteria bacterium]